MLKNLDLTHIMHEDIDNELRHFFTGKLYARMCKQLRSKVIKQYMQFLRRRRENYLNLETQLRIDEQLERQIKGQFEKSGSRID